MNLAEDLQTLCDAIDAALQIADAQSSTLVAAYLAQAHDAAHCHALSQPGLIADVP